jgi:hypothetical protein
MNHLIDFQVENIISTIVELSISVVPFCTNFTQLTRNMEIVSLCLFT